MKSNKKNYKSKRKTRSQKGGGIRFWKKIFLGPFWKIGEPKPKSKSRSNPKSKSRSKSRSPPKNRLPVKPRVTSRVDIVVKEHEKSMLNLKKVKKLSNAEYNEFVRRITK